MKIAAKTIIAFAIYMTFCAAANAMTVLHDESFDGDLTFPMIDFGALTGDTFDVVGTLEGPNPAGPDGQDDFLFTATGPWTVDIPVVTVGEFFIWIFDGDDITTELASALITEPVTNLFDSLGGPGKFRVSVATSDAFVLYDSNQYRCSCTRCGLVVRLRTICNGRKAQTLVN